MDNNYQFFKAPSYTFIKMAETKEGLNKWKVLETLLVLREIEHNHIDNDGYFPASKKRLIQLTHLHPATLYKALQQLEEEGYITRQSIPFKGNNHQPVKYLINYGKFDEDNSITWSEISAWLREDGYSDKTLMGLQNEPHMGLQNEPHMGLQNEPHMGLQNEPHMGLQNEPHMGLQNEPHRDDYGVQNGTTLSYLYKSDLKSNLIDQTNENIFIIEDDYITSKDMLVASLEEEEMLEFANAWEEGLLNPNKGGNSYPNTKQQTKESGNNTKPKTTSNPVKAEPSVNTIQQFLGTAAETLSYLYHQEMRLGDEPYHQCKNIVRDVLRQQGIQPLDINHFISNANDKPASFNLNWQEKIKELTAFNLPPAEAV